MTRRERFIRCLTRFLPKKIAEAPERVLINFACVLIGVSALLAERPRSLLAVWPDGFPEAWAVTMVLGGGFVLVGFWNNPRRRWANSIERFGCLMIFAAAVVYGVGVITVFGWQGTPSGVVYLGIAFAKAVRLLVSSAYRSILIQDGAAGVGT